MKLKTISIGILLSIIFVFSIHAQQEDFPILKGPYLSQKPPGITPEIFAPGIISSGMNEASLAFAPDFSELYYDLTHNTHRYTAIVSLKMKYGIWQRHKVAPFSGKFMDSSPYMAWDKQKLFYCSNRPFREDHDYQDFDVWYVERVGSTWSEPINLGLHINSDKVDVNPCVIDNGSLYFASNRDGGMRGHDIY